MVKGRRQQVKQIKERNRKVIIFFKKTVFFTKKNSAVRKKIEEIIIFYEELGDQKIKKYFIGSSSRSHYMPTVSVDEFLKLINDHLEQELLNDILLKILVCWQIKQQTWQTELSFQCIFAIYTQSTIRLKRFTWD